MNQRAHQCPRGFTLIELLVVISIISLLIALLLPALALARQTAQRIACASQMRQNGINHLMYADAHRGWFPLVNSTTQAALGMDQSYPSLGAAYSIMSWYGNNPHNLVCPTHEFLGTNAQYDAGRELHIDSIYMMQTSYRFVAARGTRDYAKFYGYAAGTPASFTFYGVEQGSGQATRSDTRISPGMPNLEFAGRTETDPRSGRTHYLHAPAKMPMMLDGRRQTDPYWYIYSGSQRQANNHWQLDGINLHFLDGHGRWADQRQGTDRLNVQGGAYFKWD